MNIDTNHLVSAEQHFGSREEAMRKGYIPVPDHLSGRAEKLLRGHSHVRVPRSGNDPLTKWAAEKRRNKRSAARASRKANRR